MEYSLKLALMQPACSNRVIFINLANLGISMSSHKLNRRALLQIGLGAGAGVVGGRLLSPKAEAENAVGCATFYPRRDQLDKDIDLTLIKGHKQRAAGDVVYISGQVLDDDCRPVAGALVEIWQANKHGRYAHEADPNPAPLDPHFQGWGQVISDEQGRYSFKTIIPGAYPAGQDWWRPPHIHFKVSKRGYHELITQMYFAGNKLNDKDFILLDIAASERPKVIVKFEKGKQEDAPGSQRGVFNIVLRPVRRG